MNERSENSSFFSESFTPNWPLIVAPSRAVSPPNLSIPQTLESEHERLLLQVLSENTQKPKTTTTTTSTTTSSTTGTPTPLSSNETQNTPTYMQAFFILEHFYRATGCDDKRLRDFMASLASKSTSLDIAAISHVAHDLQRFVGGFLRAFVTAVDPVADGSTSLSVLCRTPSPSFARDFQPLGKLGSGAFGSVVKAKRQLDGAVYAIKRIPFVVSSKDVDPKPLLERVLREARTLARLDHKNVIRYYSSWIEPAEDSSVTNNSALENVFGNSSRFQQQQFAALPEPRTESNSGYIHNINSEEETEEETETNEEDEEEVEEEEEEDEQEDDLDVTSENSDGGGGGLKICFTTEGTTANTTTESLSKTNCKGKEVRAQVQSKVNAIVADKPQKFVLYVQTQCCSGKNLRQWIDGRNGIINCHECICILQGMLFGLQHIHSRGVIHRDLKPPNILLDNSENGTFIPKIADFGLAKELVGSNITTPTSNNGNDEEEEESNFSDLLYSSNNRKGRKQHKNNNNNHNNHNNNNKNNNTRGIGTLPYASPEQVNGRASEYTSKTDMFALGIIVLELFSSFQTASERARFICDLKTKGLVPPEMLVRFPEQSQLAKSLTSNCPDDRPTADQVLLNHMFFSNNNNNNNNFNNNNEQLVSSSSSLSSSSPSSSSSVKQRECLNESTSTVSEECETEEEAEAELNMLRRTLQEKEEALRLIRSRSNSPNTSPQKCNLKK